MSCSGQTRLNKAKTQYTEEVNVTQRIRGVTFSNNRNLRERWVFCKQWETLFKYAVKK